MSEKALIYFKSQPAYDIINVSIHWEGFKWKISDLKKI